MKRKVKMKKKFEHISVIVHGMSIHLLACWHAMNVGNFCSVCHDENTMNRPTMYDI